MKIRRRAYPSGRTVWRLDLGLNPHGRRLLLTFDTEAQARAELQRRQRARAKQGPAALWFSDTELLEHKQARDLLAAAGHPITLIEAVRAGLAQAQPPDHTLTLAELVERCLESKWEANLRPRYLSQLKCSALSFSRSPAGSSTQAQRPAHHIQRADIETWLRSQHWAPKTQHVYLTDLRTIFAWGIQAGHLRTNPCAGIQPPALEVNEVTTLSPGAVARLLIRAWRVPPRGGEDFADLLPYLVIGIYCGLRPVRELGQLTWDKINLAESTVIVTGRTAKSRGRRVVDLSPNAAEWLRAWQRVHGGKDTPSIVPPNFAKRWRRLRQACGFTTDKRPTGTPARPWHHDVMRHTFASYHYAQHQNEHLLKSQLGHYQGSDILFQHYRAIRTAREAARFWNLAPPKS